MPLERRAQEPVLHEDLQPLGHARGQLPATLDPAKVCDLGQAAVERLGQQVGGCYGVLDGKVDADTADGRHGVRGVTDAHQPWPVPAGEAIDPNRKEADVLPGGHLLDAVGEERGQGGDIGPEGFQASSLELLGPALGHHVAALPVLATVYEDADPPSVDASQRLLGIVGAPGQPEPENVDGGTQLLAGKLGSAAYHGVSSVTAHHEVGPYLHVAFGSLGPDPDDAAALLEQVADLGVHPQREAWVRGRVIDQKVEEVLLGTNATNRQRVGRWLKSATVTVRLPVPN